MESLEKSLNNLGLENPIRELKVDGRKYKYFDLKSENRLNTLPFCLRILYENCVRKAHLVLEKDISEVWRTSAQIILTRDSNRDILFQPSRVVLQDFTGIAALVDLTAMRDLSANPKNIDSKCPADLVVDHSVQVDFSHIEKQTAASKQQQNQVYSTVHQTFPPFYNGEYFYYEAQGATALPPMDNPGLPIQDEVCPFHMRMSYWAETLQKNRVSEMQKNCERFQFLKYVNASFPNITVIPPGTGVMHQVNLEYLARIVMEKDDFLFPDFCIGTDAHTTLVNGLGVFGFSVGTLEAESVMFDHPLAMKLPRIIGVKLIGKVPKLATSMDVVLLVSKEIRKFVKSSEELDIFVEFFGPAIDQLSIQERSAISNSAGEYNAKMAFFPIDMKTLEYLEHTGREKHSLKIIKEYLELNGLLRTQQNQDQIQYDDVLEIFLPDIVVTISGPLRPKDKVELEDVAKDFSKNFPHFNGIFNLDIDGQFHSIKDGSVLLSSIASCSNSSNPSVMLTAGLLAKKAVEAGLSVPKFVKRSLSPGSGVVTSYLQDSGVMPYLHMLGFEVMGYGCSTCVENSCVPPLLPPESLVCCGVLAGNRNFEGRILPEIKANYLASPPLVIAYSIAGRIDIDFENEPLGIDSKEKPIFLKDIWPSRSEVQEIERCQVIPSVFKLVSNRINYGNKEWSNLQVPNKAENSLLYQWNIDSTFIRPPNYLQDMTELSDLKNMRCLLKLGNNVTCDLISPAGSIVRGSSAAEYLTQKGLVPRQFQSFGTRRGNSEVMARGTFSHSKLKNVMKGVSKMGPSTIHCPSGVATTIFEASLKYKEDKVPLVVIAGHNFGGGSARDWATKGPYLLGIRAILAKSFSSIYRHNMIKTGLLPIQIDEETFDFLTGHEMFEIKLDLDNDQVEIVTSEKTVKAKHLLQNAYEIALFKDGGVIRQTLQEMK